MTTTNKTPKPVEFYVTYKTIELESDDSGPRPVIFAIDKVFTSENAQLRAAIADKTDIVSVRAGESVGQALARIEKGEPELEDSEPPTVERPRGKKPTTGE